MVSPGILRSSAGFKFSTSHKVAEHKTTTKQKIRRKKQWCHQISQQCGNFLHHKVEDGKTTQNTKKVKTNIAKKQQKRGSDGRAEERRQRGSRPFG